MWIWSASTCRRLWRDRSQSKHWVSPPSPPPPPPAAAGQDGCCGPGVSGADAGWCWQAADTFTCQLCGFIVLEWRIHRVVWGCSYSNSVVDDTGWFLSWAALLSFLHLLLIKCLTSCEAASDLIVESDLVFRCLGVWPRDLNCTGDLISLTSVLHRYGTYP